LRINLFEVCFGFHVPTLLGLNQGCCTWDLRGPWVKSLFLIKTVP
jgi:hypothetical protein